MVDSSLSSDSRDKVRDVLSSILGSAVRFQLLLKNPVEGVQLPPNRKGKRVTKPTITSEQFDQILAAIPGERPMSAALIQRIAFIYLIG